MESPLIVKLPMTDEQFFEFCQENQNLQIERNRFREILLQPLTDSTTGNREAEILGQLGLWTKQDATGVGFSSSAGFTLSTGAVRAPDGSWMHRDRWNALTQEQKERFAPICPDFIVELSSLTDDLQSLQAKMKEYQEEPGFRLGWLIDRQNRRVYIYRPNQAAEILENPLSVSADPVLPGFELNLSKVW